ncbi:MAG: hypothetical protein M3Q07_13395 [Pseudobdellovibrionaceae bacterium]|nr:hypothetical protein [Pseudobdellovibrionaceae bacterium]
MLIILAFLLFALTIGDRGSGEFITEKINSLPANYAAHRRQQTIRPTSHNPDGWLYPVVTWRGRSMRHVFLLPAAVGVLSKTMLSLAGS